MNPNSKFGFTDKNKSHPKVADDIYVVYMELNIT